MAEEELTVRASLRDQLSRPLRSIRGRVDETRRSSDKLTSSTRQQAGALQRAQRRMRQFGGALRGVSRRMDRMARGALRLGRTLGRSLRRSALIATVAIVGLGAAGVKAFAEFEGAMTESLAIMGDVSEDTRDRMERTAREVAKTTQFAATEAAEAYFFLASAGLDAEQQLAAMPRVAKFAQAGQFDLARATDLATDAQSALGLTVDDTEQNIKNLDRTMDVLVGANTLANASVEQFSEALTNRAGAALRTVNKDVEEGVAVLAAMADQGIKGVRAGESLSIILRDLQRAAQGEEEAFANANVAVFNQEGNLRNLADIIGDLEGRLSGMSDAQVRAELTALGFQEESMQQILTLLGTSDAIREYEESLRSAGGVVDEVADNQMQSLSAQFGLAKDRVRDLFIEFGQRLEPALTAIVGVFNDDLIPSADSMSGRFDRLEARAQRFADRLPSMIERARQVAGAFQSAGGGLAGFRAAFANVAPPGAVAVLDAVISVGRDLATLLTGALIPAFQSSGETLPTWLQPLRLARGLLSVLANNVGLVRSALQVLLPTLIAVRAATFAYNAALAVSRGAVAAYGAAVTVVHGRLGIVRAATAAWTAVQWALNVALTANPIGIVIAAIAALVAGVILAYQHSETFRTIVDSLWAAIKSFMGTVISVTKTVVTFVSAVVKAIAKSKTFQGIVDAISSGFSTVVGWVRKVVGWLGKLTVPGALRTIADLAASAGSALASMSMPSWLGGGGDTAISHARSGSLDTTLAAHHQLDQGQGGNRILNAAVDRGSGDHAAGRALDLQGPWLQHYQQRLAAAGGWGEMHGEGDNRHLHAVYDSATADSRIADQQAAAASPPAGGDGQAGPLVGSLKIDVAGGDGLDEREIGRQVEQALRRIDQDRRERR